MNLHLAGKRAIVRRTLVQVHALDFGYQEQPSYILFLTIDSVGQN